MKAHTNLIIHTQHQALIWSPAHISRPASWIDLISSITVRLQIIVTIVSLDSIFDFVSVSAT